MKSQDLSNIALASVREIISEEEFKEIHDYINKHNEWGLAMENLIAIIIEENKQASEEQLIKIENAMKSMNLGDSDSMLNLKKHCKKID